MDMAAHLHFGEFKSNDMVGRIYCTDRVENVGLMRTNRCISKCGGSEHLAYVASPRPFNQVKWDTWPINSGGIAMWSTKFFKILTIEMQPRMPRETGNTRKEVQYKYLTLGDNDFLRNAIRRGFVLPNSLKVSLIYQDFM